MRSSGFHILQIRSNCSLNNMLSVLTLDFATSMILKRLFADKIESFTKSEMIFESQMHSRFVYFSRIDRNFQTDMKNLTKKRK